MSILTEAVNIHGLNRNILNALAGRAGFENADIDDPEVRAELQAKFGHLSPTEVLNEFLEWEGIINYTALILNAQASITAQTILRVAP